MHTAERRPPHAPPAHRARYARLVTATISRTTTTWRTSSTVFVIHGIRISSQQSFRNSRRRQCHYRAVKSVGQVLVDLYHQHTLPPTHPPQVAAGGGQRWCGSEGAGPVGKVIMGNVTGAFGAVMAGSHEGGSLVTPTCGGQPTPAGGQGNVAVCGGVVVGNLPQKATKAAQASGRRPPRRCQCHTNVWWGSNACNPCTGKSVHGTTRRR